MSEDKCETQIEVTLKTVGREGMSCTGWSLVTEIEEGIIDIESRSARFLALLVINLHDPVTDPCLSSLHAEKAARTGYPTC